MELQTDLIERSEASVKKAQDSRQRYISLKQYRPKFWQALQHRQHLHK